MKILLFRRDNWWLVQFSLIHSPVWLPRISVRKGAEGWGPSCTTVKTVPRRRHWSVRWWGISWQLWYGHDAVSRVVMVVGNDLLFVARSMITSCLVAVMVNVWASYSHVCPRRSLLVGTAIGAKVLSIGDPWWSPSSCLSGPVLRDER